MPTIVALPNLAWIESDIASALRCAAERADIVAIRKYADQLEAHRDRARRLDHARSAGRARSEARRLRAMLDAALPYPTTDPWGTLAMAPSRIAECEARAEWCRSLARD